MELVLNGTSDDIQYSYFQYFFSGHLNDIEERNFWNQEFSFNIGICFWNSNYNLLNLDEIIIIDKKHKLAPFFCIN